MRLYLVRHGQTAWNLQGKAQGHTDTPLDEVGVAQAIQLAESFRQMSIDQVWTSDLVRSLETARSLASVTGSTLEITALLRERSFGEWEGSQYVELHERLRAMSSDQDEFYARPPGGESTADVWERIEGVYQEILGTDCASLAVVSHGGVCAALLAKCLRGSIHTTRSFRFGNTAVSELLRRPDGFFNLVRYADTSHLAQQSAPMIDAHHVAK